MLIRIKLTTKLDLSNCELCGDEYCMIIRKALTRKCVFCDKICKNPICENKHISIKCEKRLLYEWENSFFE
jgi:hypothetical protein